MGVKLDTPSGNAGAVKSNASLSDVAVSTQRAKLGDSLFNNIINLQDRYQGSVLLPKGVFLPTIPAPNMDPDTAAVFMMALMSQVSESESKGIMQIMVSNMKTNDSLNTEIFKNMSDNIKKATEIANQRKSQQISNDVGLGFSTAAAILGLIATVALSVFSLGVGAPAVIAAALGVGQAMMSVADRIAESTEAKWKKSDGTEARIKISWEGMMERIMDHRDLIPQAIKDKGDDAVEKYQQEITMAYSIALTITMLGASLVAGFASVTGNASKVADAVQNAAKLSAKLNVHIANWTSQATEAISSGAQVVEAASMIVSGSYGVSIAVINFQMKEADNKKNYFFAMQEAVNQYLDSNRDAIAKNIETLGSTYETMGSVVADVRDVATRSSSAISRS
jgi:hypothetical protein